MALYGPTESGKSEIMNLLAGVKNSNFKGSCKVMGADLLNEELLPA